MASAYELMLVLRGRNYLSNDLRRAGADLRGLKAMSALQNSRAQLSINAQRLASTRAIAQEEVRSITTGTRYEALQKATLAFKKQELLVTKQLTEAQRAVTANQDAQLANSERLAANQAALAVAPFRSQSSAALREQQQLLLKVDQDLIAEQARLNEQLVLAQNNMARVAAEESRLVALETEHAHRLEILNDRINTTNASLALNEVKLNENAMAMRRLPFEKFAAGAKYVEHLGRTFQTFGLIATAALGFAAHSASKFNTELTLASTQATLIGDRTTAKVQANAQALNKAITEMLISGQIAVKPADLNQGLYTIFSGLSLKGDQKRQLQEGVDLLKEFSKTFTANFGQVPFNDVVKTGIALINNFGLSAKTIPAVMNQMQASVRFGALTMGELTTSLNQVIPAFKSAGYSTKQMFTDIAFVSRLFPSLRFGTTGLARLTETFAKYHEAISQDVGQNIAPGGQLRPINEIVAAILKAHPTFIKGGVDAQNYFKTITGTTSTVQARRAFVGYIQNLGLYRDIAGKVKNDNHELDKSFRDMSQTPQVRWAELTNELRGLVLEIGTNALPVFQKFAKPISDAVHWFDKLSPSTKKTIGDFAAWAAVGMLVGGTGLVLIGVFGRMYAAVRLLLIGRAGVAALEAGFISGGAALRLGLIGAIIVAIPLLIKYHDGIMRVVNAMGGLKAIAEVIGYVLAAWKIATILNSLKMLSWMAGGAAGEVLGLQKVLAALAVLGPISIPIIVTILFRKQIEDAAHYISNQLSKIPIIGGAFKDDPKGFKALLKARKEAQTKAANDSAEAAQKTAKSFEKQFGAVAELTKGLKRAGPKPVGHAPFKPGVTPPPIAFTDSDVLAAVKNIVKLDEFAKKHPSLDSIKAKNAAIAALQNKASKDQFAAASELISSMESADDALTKKTTSNAKKRAKVVVDEAKKAQKEVTQAAQTLQGQYASAFNQNQSAFGSLFGGPFSQSPREQDIIQWGGHLSGKDLLKDLRSQVAQFKTWRSLLNRLVKMGIPFELLQQIEAAGPASIDNVKALLTLPKADLRSYFKTFESAEGPGGLLQVATKQDMALQLKQYRKYGRNIALQIIQGLKDENTPMLSYFEKLIMSMFPGLAKDAKGKAAILTKGSASTKTLPAHKDPKPKPPSGGHTGLVRTTQGVTHHNESHTYVVHAKPDASLDTQLKHATFAQRNRTKH